MSYLGSVEPHAGLLRTPHDEALIFKVMSVRDLLSSIEWSYLYFTRIDSYTGEEADQADGHQLQGDQPDNEALLLFPDAGITASDYYKNCRSRTYACCFSLEESVSLWKKYGGGDVNGKVCVVFKFGTLRDMLNRTRQWDHSILQVGTPTFDQILDINYGIVEYVDSEKQRANLDRPPNPITYTYCKSRTFKDEKELRVSLSALGLGKFVLANGSQEEFPRSWKVFFDFRSAIVKGDVKLSCLESECDRGFLESELKRLHFETRYRGEHACLG